MTAAPAMPSLADVRPLSRTSKIYVAGHRGLVGSAVFRYLAQEGFTNLIGRRSDELDLRDRARVFDFFRAERPDVVILAAARVGGIAANAAQPAEFLSDNLLIQVNVLDAAHANDVERLLMLGSSCIYPKFAAQPIRELSLMTGLLEPTNDAYAIAKIAGLRHVKALRQEYGRRYIAAMPTNLYGPGDNFDLDSSHVLPALIRRFHEARVAGAPHVTLWGTGAPRREFLHVDDLARACLLLLERYDELAPINVGAGCDITIAELAVLVGEVVGFEGVVQWDHDKPDGTPRKLLDLRRIQALGWEPEISLRDGIIATYDWFVTTGAAGHPS